MGNIDSNENRLKRGSSESFSIMGCQPNRIRGLNDFPDNLSLQHMKNFHNKKLKNNIYNNINNNKNIGNDKSDQNHEDTDSGGISVTVAKHRSLSPQFSNSWGSLSIPQRSSLKYK